jgi:hypothetical protein
MRPVLRYHGLCLAVIAVLAGAMPAAAEWVDWIADVAVPFEYTDNLNVSAFESDREDDFLWLPTAFLGRVYQLTDRTRVSITAGAEGRVYHRFDRLNGALPGGRLSAVHKFGVGDAPWFRVSFFGGYLSLVEDDRSGANFDLDARFGKRFSPRFDANVGYVYTNRDGGNGPVAVPTIGTNVFDQERHGFSVAGNYLLTNALLLSAKYKFGSGDFDSACTVGNVGEVLAREGSNVRAIALDQVFGGCVYRLRGESHALAVHLNHGIGDHFSVDLGYRFISGQGRSLDYWVNTAAVTLLYAF